MPSTRATRAYTSTRRTLQAAQTRSEVLRAAVACFDAGGWAGTTLATIAAEAGVSVETIYKGYGSKKALLRAAIDVAIVGDAEPVPFVDRPEFASMGVGTGPERIAHAVAVTATIHERSAGVWRALVEAASADAEVEQWRMELEGNRRIEVGRGAAQVVGGPVDDDLVTMLWVLYSPETYLKLRRDGGLTRAQYERFLREVSRRIIDGSPERRDSRP